MKILVCIKRVPDTGAKIELSEDQRAVATRNLGFAISPHEECGVEAAVQLIETHGGTGTVLTLGPPDAEDQLRDSLARGLERGILLETDDEEWEPQQTAQAIAAAIRGEAANGHEFDLIMFGNESADSGGFQVGVRVAYALGLPCVGGAKGLEVRDGKAIVKREIASGWEIFEIPLPVVVTVKEGLNLPRHPSLRGTMQAKKKTVDRVVPQKGNVGLEMVLLKHPAEQHKQVEMLGQGPSAAAKALEVLKKLEVLK